MYVHDLDGVGLGHLGKKKRFKKLTKKITKIAKPVVRAVAAYYTGGASEVAYQKMRAARKAAAPAPIFEPAPPPEAMPAPQSATEAITSAARNWFASRLPRPTPPQPSPAVYEEAEAAEGQPRARAAGFTLGGVNIPPALLIAGIGLPLLFIVLRTPARGSRR